MTKYKLTKQDTEEMMGLLVFLRGVTKNTPIKRVVFSKNQESNTLIIQRWNDYSKTTFSSFKFSLENEMLKSKKS